MTTCNDCKGADAPFVTCDDAKTRCCACTVKAGFCVKCGRVAAWGVCETCKKIADHRAAQALFGRVK